MSNACHREMNQRLLKDLSPRRFEEAEYYGHAKITGKGAWLRIQVIRCHSTDANKYMIAHTDFQIRSKKKSNIHQGIL